MNVMLGFFTASFFKRLIQNGKTCTNNPNMFILQSMYTVQPINNTFSKKSDNSTSPITQETHFLQICNARFLQVVFYFCLPLGTGHFLRSRGCSVWRGYTVVNRNLSLHSIQWYAFRVDCECYCPPESTCSGKTSNSRQWYWNYSWKKTFHPVDLQDNKHFINITFRVEPEHLKNKYCRWLTKLHSQIFQRSKI